MRGSHDSPPSGRSCVYVHSIIITQQYNCWNGPLTQAVHCWHIITPDPCPLVTRSQSLCLLWFDWLFFAFEHFAGLFLQVGIGWQRRATMYRERCFFSSEVIITKRHRLATQDTSLPKKSSLVTFSLFGTSVNIPYIETLCLPIWGRALFTQTSSIYFHYRSKLKIKATLLSSFFLQDAVKMGENASSIWCDWHTWLDMTYGRGLW